MHVTNVTCKGFLDTEAKFADDTAGPLRVLYAINVTSQHHLPVWRGEKTQTNRLPAGL